MSLDPSYFGYLKKVFHYYNFLYYLLSINPHVTITVRNSNVELLFF